MRLPASMPSSAKSRTSKRALVGIGVLQSDARVAKAFLYEPPFDAGGYHVWPPGFIERYAELVDAGRREDALDAFYPDVLAMDPEPLHSLPVWEARKLAAHTLVREQRSRRRTSLIWLR